MSQDKLTFEYVNDLVEKTDLEALGTPGLEAAGVCEVYARVRPILEFLASLPFPEKWKKILKIFMQFMDRFCPQG